MKEFLLRSASGIVYAAVMIGSITISPWLFLGVFLFILVTSLFEFYQLLRLAGSTPSVFIGVMSSVLIFLGLFLTRVNPDYSKILIAIPFIMLVILALPIIQRKNQVIESISSTLLGIVTIGLPISIFNFLVFNNYKEGFDYQIVLFLFIILWVNDTGAYISGSLFGRHKLLPRISPKKTWEGFAGGLLLAFVAAWAFTLIFNGIPRHHLWILCPAIVLAGTVGDLVESAWKRAAGVKDSGKLIPGHGGILDRFDSLLFAAPMVFIIITLLT